MHHLGTAPAAAALIQQVFPGEAALVQDELNRSDRIRWGDRNMFRFVIDDQDQKHLKPVTLSTSLKPTRSRRF